MCQSIHHYEIVGSFLRPEVLKEGRKQFEQQEISAEALKLIEDNAIAELVEKQKEAGLALFSDGEFRRSYWHLDFFWGFLGVEHIIKEQGYLFHGEETRADSASLTGRVEYNPNHPVFEEFNFLANLVGPENVRQSIPAPAQFYTELIRDTNEEKINQIYPNRKELYEDIATAYTKTIHKLYELGARHIKLDDCTWGMLVDQTYWATKNKDAYDPKALQELYLNLNNAAIKDLPNDLHITTHVCRGNYHSTWAATGGYEPVAETLFSKEDTSAFFLEFDDERSGNFEPLRYVPENKQVVLGLVTSKDGRLEDKETIIARIKEATQYVPLERLSLSPQCGFASTEEGNILTEDDQWQKIALVKEIAEEVWSSN